MQFRLGVAPGGLTRLSKDAMSNQPLSIHDESTALVHAPTDRVFAYLDDPKSLSAHMGESSIMMIGSRMSVEVDAGGGRALVHQADGRRCSQIFRPNLQDQTRPIARRQLLRGRLWKWLGLLETFLYGIYVGLVFAPQYKLFHAK